MTEPRVYATVEDLEQRLGEPLVDTAKRDRAQALLHDASTLIRATAGRDWDDPVPEVVATVCVGAAIRAWRNPEGVRQKQIGQVSTTFATADVVVTLTDEERRLIRVAAGHGVAIDSIQLTTGYAASRTVFVPVAGGGDLLPWLSEP